jgi:hypothetical protein
MTKQYVTADELKKAADYLASTKEQGGCYSWKVYANTDDHKDISIVLGWTDGFDKNDPDKDKYQDDTWRLAVKVGYQPSNSMMQCDYDVDFNLPYNPDNGDVCDDCEYCIYETTNFEALAKDINQNASWVIKHWKELGHE